MVKIDPPARQRANLADRPATPRNGKAGLRQVRIQIERPGELREHRHRVVVTVDVLPEVTSRRPGGDGHRERVATVKRCEVVGRPEV